MTHVTHAPADRRTATSEALTAMTGAWQSIEAAREHARELHRHAGLGDAHLARAVALLRTAGHHDLADAVCHHLVGHGVLGEQDEDFVRTLMTLEEQVRARTRGLPGQAG